MFPCSVRAKHAQTRGVSGADPGLTVGGGVKYTARVSAREILCATPTFGL